MSRSRKLPKKARRPAIPCPRCRTRISAVLRTTVRGDTLQRLRKCSSCGHRWLTREGNDTGVTRLAIGVETLLAAVRLAPAELGSPVTVKAEGEHAK